MANIEVVGTVDTKFTSFQWGHTYSNKGIGKKAYKLLKEEANNKYMPYEPDNKIDVVNISAKGKFSVGRLFIMVLCYPLIILGNSQKIHANGDVILLANGETIEPLTDIRATKTSSISTPTRNISTPKNISKGLEDAIKRVISSLMNGLPGGLKIAVVNVESDDKNTASLVIDEVEFHLVSTKRFTIVDRSTLDLIIKEQKFQMSGAVNDNDVVQIGALSGANVVIAGSVIKSENTNRLSLKALDVKTGQIITMARESYY